MALWNKGGGFVKTNLPSQRSCSMGLDCEQCILMEMGAELDKGASLCSGAQFLFGAQRGPCFLPLDKEAYLYDHTLSHL